MLFFMEPASGHPCDFLVHSVNSHNIYLRSAVICFPSTSASCDLSIPVGVFFSNVIPSGFKLLSGFPFMRYGDSDINCESFCIPIDL
jgi:hypothetical protein